jgi:hypothetical protein
MEHTKDNFPVQSRTHSLSCLELYTAVLLIKLYHAVIQAIDLTLYSITFCSDSTIILHWISTASYVVTHQYRINTMALCTVRNKPRRFTIARRHPKITHQLSHLISKIKLALPVKRHLDALGDAANIYPWKLQGGDIKTTIETRLNILNNSNILGYFKRIMTCCLRFIYNTWRNERNTGPLTVRELYTSFTSIIKLVQRAAIAIKFLIWQRTLAHVKIINYYC